MLVIEALRNGSVDDERIRSSLTGDDELEDTTRTEIEANLRLVLGDDAAGLRRPGAVEPAAERARERAARRQAVPVRSGGCVRTAPRIL